MTPESIQAIIDQALLRARQPAPDTRILDHQDASGNADSHVKFATCTPVIPDNKRRLMIHPETTMVNQQQPSRGRMFITVYNMGQRKEAVWGDLCPSHQSAISTIMDRLKNTVGEKVIASRLGVSVRNEEKMAIYSDTGVDRSFISTTFSSPINIAPTPLENSYDVKLANGKIVGIDTII
ncbi:hypothetical protein Tco_0674324 [Tanacetum coccineum]